MGEDGVERVVFDDHIIYSSAMGARTVAVANLDGDDDLDVLSASYSDNTIRWYENEGRKVIDGVEGDVVFSDHIVSSNAANVFLVATADIDNDDVLDVVGESNDDILWYKNNGVDGFSTNTVAVGNLHGVAAVAVADLDGDDDLDVVVGRDSGYLIWYKK